MVFLCKIHRSLAGPYRGVGGFQVTEMIEGFGGLKFSIAVTFWVGKFDKYSFCVAINLSGDFSRTELMFKLDYEHSLFPGLVRRASEKKSARKISRRLAKTETFQFSCGADFFFFSFFAFFAVCFRSRDGLSWEMFKDTIAGLRYSDISLTCRDN